MKLGDKLTKENYTQGAIFCNKNGYKINPKSWIIEEVVTQTQTYRELRQNEYPSIGEQLDMIYWDKVNSTNLWQEKIAQIKAKYPKE